MSVEPIHQKEIDDFKAKISNLESQQIIDVACDLFAQVRNLKLSLKAQKQIADTLQTQKNAEKEPTPKNAEQVKEEENQLAQKEAELKKPSGFN